MWDGMGWGRTEGIPAPDDYFGVETYGGEISVSWGPCEVCHVCSSRVVSYVIEMKGRRGEPDSCPGNLFNAFHPSTLTSSEPHTFPFAFLLSH